MFTNYPRIRLVESRLITKRDFIDGKIPTQMCITTFDGEPLLNQPCLVRPPFMTHDESLKKAIYELIRRTEAVCSPAENNSSTDEVENHPHDFNRNINCLVYEGIENFIGMGELELPNYKIPEQFRFKQAFLNSRRTDGGWHSLLYNWGIVRSIHPSLQELSSESNYALNFYMTRKLDVNVPLTILDAYVVANCYHAELTFYATTFENELNDWRFNSQCEYNYNPETKPRPKWAIVFDNKTFCYYPILSGITSEMYYGYKHGQYGSLLIHNKPDMRIVLK